MQEIAKRGFYLMERVSIYMYFDNTQFTIKIKYETPKYKYLLSFSVGRGCVF